jgi:hypothetical protein
LKNWTTDVYILGYVQHILYYNSGNTLYGYIVHVGGHKTRARACRRRRAVAGAASATDKLPARVGERERELACGLLLLLEAVAAAEAAHCQRAMAWHDRRRTGGQVCAPVRGAVGVTIAAQIAAAAAAAPDKRRVVRWTATEAATLRTSSDG